MKTTLGEIAEVIRCQLPRQRAAGSDGWVLCQEVVQADFGTISGLVDDVSENVWVEIDPKKKQQKYLVRDGDILFSFRGTESTLGQVGLYIGQNKEFVVCGQSLCILRPKNVDGTWFYYYIRKREIREVLLAKAAGSRLMTINLNDLREVLLEMPTEEDFLAVHRKHSRILEIHKKMNILRKELIELMK
ncbi:hypothetical protein GTA51_01490 [Desulfovibrio aerotolerans]|uniref:Type I restriction modification DNA specificity domain-containing protein n=1 Tax=Solidesulfovibrio aerotolerans TaxID=295255 RepID=A0A7C9MMI5_9BACT|nr:restriction endonuclease subunit S [Solidesulfovibrio aerotolerans]MYL81812.1 hypothetical protein [Solidesulfovibrio aerotolerans]